MRTLNEIAGDPISHTLKGTYVHLATTKHQALGSGASYCYVMWCHSCLLLLLLGRSISEDSEIFIQQLSNNSLCSPLLCVRH